LPQQRFRTAICRPRSKLKVVALIALATSACGASSAGATHSLGRFPEVPRASFAATTAGSLQSTIDAAVAGGLPGITATVLAAGRGAWSGAAGTADGAHPMDVHSTFGIASITKTVLAAEVMRLSEIGSLKLSDQVSEHLPPDLHFDTNDATIENLLSMESGIPDPAQVPDLSGELQRRWTPEQILATVPSDRAKPGDHFVYEDANYMLLSLVIRQTTGMSVSAALRSHVLADPRLSSMVYQPDERPKEPLALPFLDGHVRPNILALGGGYLPSLTEASNANGSGCMASDSPALALWGYLLFGGSLVSQPSLLAMTDFGTGTTYDRYGLGVFDQTHLGDGFGVQSIGNGGWDNGGYSSILAVLPSKGIVISVMTNQSGDPVSLVVPVAQKLASVLLA
jgi:D-alanyl-D-alanine carboxypeptidase